MPPPGNRISNWIRNTARSQKTFVKFAIVGASGVVVNEFVYYAMTRFAHLPYIPSQAIGVELAIVNNFIWNDSMTFKNSPVQSISKIHRFGKYNLLSLMTFAVNLVVFAILLSLHVWDIYASILAIVASFGLNYFGSAKWAWRPKKEPQSGSTA